MVVSAGGGVGKYQIERFGIRKIAIFENNKPTIGEQYIAFENFGTIGTRISPHINTVTI